MAREVRCPYGREWVPMGRARTRCPSCGAVVGGSAHPLRETEENATRDEETDHVDDRGTRRG